MVQVHPESKHENSPPHIPPGFRDRHRLPLLSNDTELPGRSEKGCGRAARMVLVGRPLGMYAPTFPEQAWPRLRAQPVSEGWCRTSKDFTVISGMSHRYARAISPRSACSLASSGLHSASDIRNSISSTRKSLPSAARPALAASTWGRRPSERRGVRLPAEQKRLRSL